MAAGNKQEFTVIHVYMMCTSAWFVATTSIPLQPPVVHACHGVAIHAAALAGMHRNLELKLRISCATHDFLHAYMMHLIQGGGLCHIEG